MDAGCFAYKLDHVEGRVVPGKYQIFIQVQYDCSCQGGLRNKGKAKVKAHTSLGVLLLPPGQDAPCSPSQGSPPPPPSILPGPIYTPG